MPYGTGKHTYELAKEWAKLPKGWSFLDVAGLATDSQDRVYVLNRSDHPVMVFDREGNFLTLWGEGYFKRAHGSCEGPDGSIYCTDDGHHIVSKFTPEGKLLLELGNKDQPSDTGFVHTPGLTLTACLHMIKRPAPPFNWPTGVSLSASGEIYVSDGYGNARVHKFSPTGKLLLSWGEPGTSPGQFRLPHWVWVDKQDRVWVADRENGRLQIFDSRGKFLSQWTDLGRPTGVVIDEDVVYVSELSPPRVSIFTIKGKLLARWGNEQQDNEKILFLAPHSIALDSWGAIYIGDVAMAGFGIDRGSKSLRKFSRIS